MDATNSTKYTTENIMNYKHDIADCIVKDEYFLNNLENFKHIEFRKAYFDQIVKWLKTDHPLVNIKDVIEKVYEYMVLNSVLPKRYDAEIKAFCKGFYKHGRPTTGNELTAEERKERKRQRSKDYYIRNREAVCLRARIKHNLKKRNIETV